MSTARSSWSSIPSGWASPASRGGLHHGEVDLEPHDRSELQRFDQGLVEAAQTVEHDIPQCIGERTYRDVVIRAVPEQLG